MVIPVKKIWPSHLFILLPIHRYVALVIYEMYAQGVTSLHVKKMKRGPLMLCVFY